MHLHRQRDANAPESSRKSESNLPDCIGTWLPVGGGGELNSRDLMGRSRWAALAGATWAAHDLNEQVVLLADAKSAPAPPLALFHFWRRQRAGERLMAAAENLRVGGGEIFARRAPISGCILRSERRSLSRWRRDATPRRTAIQLGGRRRPVERCAQRPRHRANKRAHSLRILVLARRARAHTSRPRARDRKSRADLHPKRRRRAPGARDAGGTRAPLERPAGARLISRASRRAARAKSQAARRLSRQREREDCP